MNILRKIKSQIVYLFDTLVSFFRKTPYKQLPVNDYQSYISEQRRSEPREFLEPRLKIISSVIFLLPLLEASNIAKNKEKIKILDVGCRDGWTIKLFNDLGYKNVVGTEILPDYVNYCNKKGRNAVIGDIHKLPFNDNKFDITYCRHTLEHSLDPIMALTELLRVTKKDGVLYCSFPLERKPYGKHPIAITTITDIKKILSKVPYNKKIFVGLAKQTKIVIPEGKEAIIIVSKK